MNRMIFVNLPVSDVTVSRAFYTGLGFTVNEQFSDEQVTAIVVSDQIVVMLLERPRFEDFLQGTQVADAHIGAIGRQQPLGGAGRLAPGRAASERGGEERQRRLRSRCRNNGRPRTCSSW